MNEPKTYSANDIERYHRGEMTPAEMHLLEKAALDDPFLTDALEGYKHTATASADLGTLQMRLQERIEGKRRSKVVPFFLPWMKVAALLVILAGGGWLVFQTFSSRDNNYSEMVSSGGSTTNKNVVVSNADSGSAASTFVSPPTASTVEKESKDIASVEASKSTDNTRQKPVQMAAKTKARSDAVASEQSGYAASATSLAKPGANAELQDTNLLSPTQQSTAAVSAPISDTVQHIDVVMKPIEGNHQEVVVVGYTKSKRLAGRASGVTIDTLEPAEGWSSFDSYVADNLDVPKELREKKPLSSEVELSFDVDKEGNPVNITVTKSLCDRCDAEAVRLLKEGPKWKGKKKRGKVRIPFPLSP